MTEDQYQKAQDLSRCIFSSGTWDKRFARTLQGYTLEKKLTENQAFWLEQLYHRYRRQISNHSKSTCKICASEMKPLTRKDRVPENQRDITALENWKKSVQETHQPSEQDKQPKLFE